MANRLYTILFRLLTLYNCWGSFVSASYFIVSLLWMLSFFIIWYYQWKLPLNTTWIQTNGLALLLNTQTKHWFLESASHRSAQSAGLVAPFTFFFFIIVSPVFSWHEGAVSEKYICTFNSYSSHRTIYIDIKMIKVIRLKTVENCL